MNMGKTRFFVLFWLQVWCVSAFSGNIAKMYKTHLTERGMVYFIMPQKMPKAAKSTAQKDLLFDITCLAQNDSVSITATVWATQAVTDSMATVCLADGTTMSFPVEFLYRELRKKGYESRIRINMLKSQFREMFNGETPFMLDFGKGNRFAFRKGFWAEEQTMINSIMDMMQLNQ